MIKNHNNDFSIHNIPFGIFSIENEKKRVGTIIGEEVVDLYALAQLGIFDDLEIKKKFFEKIF